MLWADSDSEACVGVKMMLMTRKGGSQGLRVLKCTGSHKNLETKLNLINYIRMMPLQIAAAVVSLVSMGLAASFA